MEGLSGARRHQLSCLLRHLSTFPTPELIVTSHKIRISELTDHAVRRMRHAMGGAWAFGKIGSYLAELRLINERRHNTGLAIHALEVQFHDTDQKDVVSRVSLREEINRLSGLQEVYYHQYASTVHTIKKLMTLVSESAGFDIPADIRSILGSYEPLRNYFEHLERAAPGRDQAQHVVTETRSETEWHIVHGLPSDGDGRIVLGEDVIDVTNRGLQAIEDAVERIHPMIRESIFRHLERFFTRNPDQIPNVTDVPYKRLVSTPPLT